MKLLGKNIRSFVFLIIVLSIVSGVLTVPVFTESAETVKSEVSNTSICPDCYIVYVWIEEVRWVQIYDADGKMVDMYPDLL
jgi:hypothetical protein